MLKDIKSKNNISNEEQKTRILQLLVSTNNMQAQILNEMNKLRFELKNMLQSFKVGGNVNSGNNLNDSQQVVIAGVPSIIPHISTRQIYLMIKRGGWDIKQVSAISGYSLEDIKKKYIAYERDHT